MPAAVALGAIVAFSNCGRHRETTDIACTERTEFIERTESTEREANRCAACVPNRRLGAIRFAHSRSWKRPNTPGHVACQPAWLRTWAHLQREALARRHDHRRVHRDHRIPCSGRWAGRVPQTSNRATPSARFLTRDPAVQRYENVALTSCATAVRKAMHTAGTRASSTRPVSDPVVRSMLQRASIELRGFRPACAVRSVLYFEVYPAEHLTGAIANVRNGKTIVLHHDRSGCGCTERVDGDHVDLRTNIGTPAERHAGLDGQ